MKYLAVIFSIFIVILIVLANLDAIPLFISKLYDFPNGDKLGHLTLFGMLNFFITSAFLSHFTLNHRRVALSVGLILALAVTAEEFSQQFFSARTYDLLDLTASLLGLFVGGWVAWRLNKWQSSLR